jgi:hypothetical protein
VRALLAGLAGMAAEGAGHAAIAGRRFQDVQPQPRQSKNQTQAFTGIVANVACCNARD